MRVRSALMVEITRYIKLERLTQAAAAKRFGVTQPRISDLVCGRINLFSVDTLINMLSRAGLKVSVRIQKPRVA